MNLRVFRSPNDLREGLRNSCQRAANTSLIPSMIFGGSGVVGASIDPDSRGSSILVSIAEQRRRSSGPESWWREGVTWIDPAESPCTFAHAPFDLAVVELEALRSARDFFEEVARRSRRFIVVDDGSRHDPVTEDDLVGLEPMSGTLWIFSVMAEE